MSIRTTLLLAFAALGAVLLAQAVLATRTAAAVSAQAEAAGRRHRSLALADELRQSSDDLTRMARTYVETGDPRFAAYFREILAIRDGASPRPEGYEGIYWDFVAAGRERPRAAGRPVALTDLMKEQGFTDEEFALLQEAKARSDALVAIEDRAMAAMAGGQPGSADVARALLHGAEYHEAKAEIMRPIQAFLAGVEARTAAEVARHEARAADLGRATQALAVLAALLALGALLWLPRRILGPVRDLSARMEDLAGGERDLTRRLEVRRRDEVGRLATRANAVLDGLQGSLREVAEAAQMVSRSAGQIATAGREQEATATSLGQATGRIAAAVTQISASSEEIAGDVRAVADTARASSSAAAAGREGLQAMEDTMRALLTATDGVAGRLRSIDARAVSITDVVTTIVKVADQTNLLSVNAAIEAEKAGQHGRGFLVVAQEIRRLADQTAEATLQIERSVGEMQGAVADGVAEMDRFSTQVRRTVEDARGAAGRMTGVVDGVKAVSERFARVEEAVAQQAQGAGQIRESTQALRAGARETLEAVGAFSRALQGLHVAVQSLESTVGRFRV